MRTAVSTARTTRWLALLAALVPCVALSVEIRSESLVLEFADNGDLLQVQSCLPDCANVPQHELRIGGDPLQAGAVVSFTGYATEPFTLTPRTGQNFTELLFESTESDGYRRWRIPQRGWTLDLEVSGAERIDVSSGQAFRPPPVPGFGALLEQPRYVLFEGREMDVLGVDETQQARDVTGWTGFRSRFWAIMLRPESPLAVEFQAGPGQVDPGLVLQDGSVQALNLALYLGPVEPMALRSADPLLADMMYASLWFWLRWICQALFWLLAVIHGLLPNWALAVMVLSVAVSLLMRPLSRIADRLQDDVHRTEARLAPKLRTIKQQYKGAEQSEKVLALYKAEKVHPLYSLKSLAGVAVVIPVFIGAFDMLAENIWLAHESFLWIADLSRPDAIAALPFDIPFFGAQLNLLPFIMTALSVAASGLHRHEAMDADASRKHVRNLVLMALAFLLLFYTFPAGMVLYWTTNNLISVIRYAWQRRAKHPAKPA